MILTVTMSHEVVMFLPEVNRESSFVLFLHVGDTGHMKQHLTEPVLVNETNTPITLQTGTDRERDRHRY